MTLEEMPEIVTAQTVATYLNISRRRVYELCDLAESEGGIPSFYIGASRRIVKARLVTWLNQKMHN